MAGGAAARLPEPAPGAGAAQSVLAALGPLSGLLADIVSLKRVGDGRTSFAERAFCSGWAAIAGGTEAGDIARRDACRAVVATVLGPADAAALGEAGMARGDIEAVFVGIVANRADILGPDLAAALGEDVRAAAAPDPPGPTPGFAARLGAVPRAGPTLPGAPRLGLPASETHGEHSWTVAAIATLAMLAAGVREPGAIGRVYLMGLAHHLHNTWLPDAGYAGEMALGSHLDGLISSGQRRALALLPEGCRPEVADALEGLGAVDTATGAAFNAADVIDRMLELEAVERRARFSVAETVARLDPVHPGPLRDFQMAALGAAGLTP